MSDWRRLLLKSGIPTSPIISIWQADAPNRSVRNPVVNDLPLENAQISGSAMLPVCDSRKQLALGSVLVTGSLLLTTLAPTGTPDQTRAPIFNKIQPPAQVRAFQPPNLLTSTLAPAAAPPFNSNPRLAAPQSRQVLFVLPTNLLPLNAVVASTDQVRAPLFQAGKRPTDILSNETRGTPKTLTQDAQLPFAGKFQPTPIRAALTAETSRGMPIELRAAAPPLPPGQASFVATPVNPWQHTVLIYRPDVDATPQSTPLPVGQATLAWVQRTNWQPANTSAGMPKPLYPDFEIPVQQQPSAQMRAPTSKWQPADTSQSAWAVRQPVAQPPIIPATFIAAPRAEWQARNTSQSTWVNFFPVPPLPPGQASWVATPPAQWQPRDTSQSTGIGFYPPPPPLPVGQASWVGVPVAKWQPLDTSQGSFAINYPFVIVVPTTANYHSWLVKGIGIKTKISLPSQVDSDTGDTS